MTQHPIPMQHLPVKTGRERALFIEQRLVSPMLRISRHLIRGDAHLLNPDDQRIVAEMPRHVRQMTGFHHVTDSCPHPRYDQLTGVRFDGRSFTFGITYDKTVGDLSIPVYVLAYIGQDDALHIYLPDNRFGPVEDVTRTHDVHARTLGFADWQALLRDQCQPKRPFEIHRMIQSRIRATLTDVDMLEDDTLCDRHVVSTPEVTS